MSYTPKFQAQLDGSDTASKDCGVRATSMGVDFATFGDKVPTVKGIRDRMGTTTMNGKAVDASDGGVTNTEQSQRAYQSFDTPAETGGHDPLKCGRFVNAAWADLVAALEQGKWVQPTVDYGYVNDSAKAKKVSGDRAFRGNHIVGVLGIITKTDGSKSVYVYDPLCDGRRKGIPKGVTIWPMWLLRDAAAAAASGGGAVTWVQVPPRFKAKPSGKSK